jgi:hypothetical protein
MKTGNELLKDMGDIAERFMKNEKWFRGGKEKFLSESYESASKMLSCAFPWDQSEEGSIYWGAVEKNLKARERCKTEKKKPLSFADDPDFPGCPVGCECPPDKGCGIG